MNLISKSIYKPDVEADDRLIASMQDNRNYSGTEIRDIIIARYRNRNLRMRVLVAFNQTVKSKKFADEVSAAIKAIDVENAALSAIEIALNVEQSPDNVVPITQASATKKKRAGKKARKASQEGEQQRTA